MAKESIGSESGNQSHNLGVRLFFGFDREQADCDWQLEATWTAGAWIEVEHVFFVVNRWPMRVAVEDSGKLCGDGIEMQRAEIVQQVDVVTLKQEYIGFGQATARALGVDVAADCMDGSDFFQCLEDGRSADVAQMQDVIDAGECGKHFRAQKSVGVADDSNLHLLKLRTRDQRPFLGFTSRALRSRYGSSI